jgi:23S rRNA pseudouridine1911/1915/1917 synthase
MSQHITIPAAADGKRLDVALAELTDLTRSNLQKRILAGDVLLDGQTVTAKQVVTSGQEYELIEHAVEAETAPELTILYQDDDVIAVDKPAGLVVHASESGRVQPTVAAFAAAQGVIDEDTARPGIVHRLDKDTSGVMLLAKNPTAKAWLQDQFKQRTIKKRYVALVRGRLNQAEAMIELPIGRSRNQPIKRAVVPGARTAKTHYKVLQQFTGSSLVEIDLQTGRTHQIRVHFSHLGHPVLGDTLYGEDKRPAGLTRQFLHAAAISFTSPDGSEHTVTSPLPPELDAYLKKQKGAV